MRVAERFLKLYRDRTMVVGFVALAAVVLLVGIEHACARVTTGSPSLGSQDLVALGYALAAGGLGLWAWRLRRRGSRRPIASLCLATALFAASLAIAVDVIGQDTAVSMPEVYFVMTLLAFAGLLPLPPARFIAVAVPGVAGAIGMVLLVGPGGTPLLRAAIVATAALIAVAMAHLNFRRIRSMFASRLRAEDAVVEHDADPGGDLTTELDVLESTARGVRSQLDNVLLWGRAREGRLEVDDGVVDVPDLVRSIAESVAAHAHLKDIDLVTDAPSVLPVRSDAGLLRAIVRNLVDNALKFTKPGGRVSVTCRLENASALVAVEDDGIGMETGDDQPQRSGTGGERGSGLGLSLVRTLVTRIGATMTIESQPGSGTAVRVCVPVGIETFERASSSAGAPVASPA